MRVRDRRVLPREAACFRDGEIDVGRSAFVCTGGAESELGKGGGGGGIRRRRRVLTQKKTTTITDTRIRVHTNVSQSAEVKPTFYRSTATRQRHACAQALGVGLAIASSSSRILILKTIGNRKGDSA